MSKEYLFKVFKGNEKGENRFVYHNRYYMITFENGNHICERNYIEMDWMMEDISRICKLDEDKSIQFRFDKPFDFRKTYHGIKKFRNLNKFEKLLFEYKLKNCDKENKLYNFIVSYQ